MWGRGSVSGGGCLGLGIVVFGKVLGLSSGVRVWFGIRRFLGEFFMIFFFYRRFLFRRFLGFG